GWASMGPREARLASCSCGSKNRFLGIAGLPLRVEVLSLFESRRPLLFMKAVAVTNATIASVMTSANKRAPEKMPILNLLLFISVPGESLNISRVGKGQRLTDIPNWVSLKL